MGNCSYTWEELDEEKGGLVEKRCPEEIWKGSDKFCIFHDPSPEKDTELFQQKLKEKLSKKNYNFAGNCFPEEADFGNIEFKDNAHFGEATFLGVYFGGATFQGDADFSGATFQDAEFGEAIFKSAIFYEVTSRDAIFIDSTFQGTADFFKATFQMEMKVIGFLKSSLNTSSYLYKQSLL